VRYEISVTRQGPGNEVSLEVDGQPIAGTVIPLPGAETDTVKVKAVIR
jgi:cellobiose phosphorylase